MAATKMQLKDLKLKDSVVTEVPEATLATAGLVKVKPGTVNAGASVLRFESDGRLLIPNAAVGSGNSGAVTLTDDLGTSSNTAVPTAKSVKAGLDRKADKADVAAVFAFKGKVDTLPASADKVGDAYVVGSDIYVWDGSEFDQVSPMDLSGYATKEEVGSLDVGVTELKTRGGLTFTGTVTLDQENGTNIHETGSGVDRRLVIGARLADMGSPGTVKIASSMDATGTYLVPNAATVKAAINAARPLNGVTISRSTTSFNDILNSFGTAEELLVRLGATLTD